MRLKLEFVLTKQELPLEYRRSFISFIKKSLTECSSEYNYYEKYYSKPEKKPFSFGILFNHPIFNKDKIILADNNVKMIISSGDTKTFQILYNAFLNQKMKAFPLKDNNYIILTNIVELRDEPINTDTVIFNTVSPICIKEHYKDNNSLDFYHSIKSDKFIEQVKFKTDLDFININTKTIIVSHFDLKIESTIGTFALKGNIQNLKDVYMNGFGDRKSEGFGLLKIN